MREYTARLKTLLGGKADAVFATDTDIDAMFDDAIGVGGMPFATIDDIDAMFDSLTA